MTAGNRVQVRVGPDLAAWLTSRAERTMPPASAHKQAGTELGLWRAVLAAELRGITLTLPQARCVADALGGPQMSPAVAAGPRMGTAYHQVFDVFRLARGGPGGMISSYGAKHAPEGTDPAKFERELLGYLESLTPAADHALADAISRWWDEVVPRENRAHEDNSDGWRADSTEGFAAVGLRVTEA